MVENIGGIRNEGPGFWKLVFAPQPGGTLTWAKVAYRSVSGPVSSSWRISGETMTVQVVVPVNATATVRLPGVAGKILESGLPVEEQQGVKVVAPGVIATGSGSYEFVYPYRP
jgi:alpha-L-rhamnosidase